MHHRSGRAQKPHGSEALRSTFAVVSVQFSIQRAIRTAEVASKQIASMAVYLILTFVNGGDILCFVFIFHTVVVRFFVFYSVMSIRLSDKRSITFRDYVEVPRRMWVTACEQRVHRRRRKPLAWWQLLSIQLALLKSRRWIRSRLRFTMKMADTYILEINISF